VGKVRPLRVAEQMHALSLVARRCRSPESYDTGWAGSGNPAGSPGPIMALLLAPKPLVALS
jgi:hypothetical protein